MDVLNHQAALTPAEIRNLESCPLGASESSGYTQKMKKEWGWSCLVFMSLSEKWPLCLLTFYGLELGHSYFAWEVSPNYKRGWEMWSSLCPGSRGNGFDEEGARFGQASLLNCLVHVIEYCDLP